MQVPLVITHKNSRNSGIFAVEVIKVFKIILKINGLLYQSHLC